MSIKKKTVMEDTRKKVKKIEARFESLRTIVSVAIAIGIVLLIISFISETPFTAIRTLLFGPLTKMRQFGNVIILMIPLTFTGLAITVAFKSNRFNMAADGAFYLGSMIACYIGIFSPFPAALTIIIALIGGAIGGALLGFIPAYLNKKFGSSELVVSLMQNYIVSYFVAYIFNNVVRDTGLYNLESYELPKGVGLGSMFKIGGTNIHWGLIIVLAIAAIVAIVLYKTKWGYALRSTGSNEKFAKYTGLNVSVIILAAQVLGIAIAGVGGAVEMLGNHRRFKWMSSPGYGFDGIIIASLAKNNPKYVPLSAFFLAYIRIGADMVNLATDVPGEIIAVVQATILILLSAKSFLSKWKQRNIVKTSVMENELRLEEN